MLFVAQDDRVYDGAFKFTFKIFAGVSGSTSNPYNGPPPIQQEVEVKADNETEGRRRARIKFWWCYPKEPIREVDFIARVPA